MKHKFILTAALCILLIAKTTAQQTSAQLATGLPLVSEDGIKEITVSNNIDVVLMQDEPENVKVKASSEVISKLKISVTDGRLFLAETKDVKDQERLAVFIWVNDLENLTLKGNSLVTSAGVLRNKNLHISADKDAKVILKSDGKVWFDSPSRYHIEQGNGYSFIQLL